jgi:hypothetical protein
VQLLDGSLELVFGEQPSPFRNNRRPSLSTPAGTAMSVVSVICSSFWLSV